MSTRAALLGFVALALVVRLAIIAATPGFEPRYDAADYDRIAAGLAITGAWPPTTTGTPGSAAAFRPPAWPAALAATYRLTGARWTAGRILAAALGAAAVGLLGLIALELWGRRAALTATALGALAPPLVAMSASLLSEALFVTCVLGALLVTLRARGPSPLAVAGALAGLAVLTRTAGVVVLGALTLAAWPRARIRGVAATLVAGAIVLAPWAVRNLTHFDRPLLTTQGGVTMAGTWNPTARDAEPPYTGAWQVPLDLPEHRAITRPPAGDEAEVSGRLRAVAVDFARDHPGYVARTAGLNLLRSQHLAGHDWLTRLSFDEMGVPATFDTALVVSRWVLLFGGVAAFASLLRRRSVGPAWLWLVPAGLVAVTVPLVGNPRYGLATDPFLVLALAGAVGHGPSVPKRNER